MIMKRTAHLLLAAVAVFFFIQCETPGSPDFTLSSSVDSPLISESSFQFLGGKNALLDTTNSELTDVLRVDGDNFITISQSQTFDFGELEDAIPGIDVEPASFQTTVGEIELSSFHSGDGSGNVGQAGFGDLTGQNFQLQQGEPIPGAQSPQPVNIQFDTDYFVSAQIKRGGIEISLQNDLGFDLDNLTIELYSGTQSLGVLAFDNFVHNSFRSEEIQLVDNPETDPEVELRDINADVEISWSTQTMQDDSGSLIINDVAGKNLFASSVDAIIPPQEFISAGSTQFSNGEFSFTSPEHFVEIASGTLSIQNIINSVDLDIDPLEISFPGFRVPPYGEADSLVVSFSGEQKIPRKNTEPVSRSIDLSDVRIYAQGNSVEYSIYAVTEDTRATGGSESRVIQETDQVSAEVVLSNLVIQEAFGVVENRQVLLTNNSANSGDNIDIMNDLEAELIDIGEVDELSKRLEGVEFTEATLSIDYATNVGVPATVIGAFLGVDANGDSFFLKGEPGTDAGVTETDPFEMLHMNGSPIDPGNLLKFTIEPSSDPAQILTSTFNRDNSNITEFLNRLPVSIRFIGLADLNKEGLEGTIQNPVVFDPSISLNIPLALKANGAQFTDTTSVDLSDLPGPGDDAILDNGSIQIRSKNNIPIGITLDLEFLSEQGELITSVPLIGDSEVTLQPALVGSGGFSVSPSEDFTTLHLNRSQLNEINRTRNVRLVAGISSTLSDEIRIRSSDDVNLLISGKFAIQNKID